jgi:4-hydroxyphenylpyruvate dioxygenase
MPKVLLLQRKGNVGVVKKLKNPQLNVPFSPSFPMPRRVACSLLCPVCGPYHFRISEIFKMDLRGGVSMKEESNFVEVLGIAFLEFSGSRPHLLTSLFDQMGFNRVGERSEGNICLYQQGDIFFISNPSVGGNAELFRSVHRRGASAMGFKVENSQAAFALAIELGATPATLTDYDIPAIKGVGQSLIYLVDEEHQQRLLELLNYQPELGALARTAITKIDHLTHNLERGGLEKMCHFYEKVFGFHKIRSFAIEGKRTGLVSEVVSSRCGRVIIPLNESSDDISQIAEYLAEYNGEGIQHIALLSEDICESVDKLTANGIPFQDTPDSYYDLIDRRLPGHGENISELYSRKILIDGGESQGGGLLLQIFTQNSIGPIFFELIQRKGNKGFGEGNFQALFESIELEQIRRGVLV